MNESSNAELTSSRHLFFVAMVFEIWSDITTVPERTNENDKGDESGEDDSTGIPRI